MTTEEANLAWYRVNCERDAHGYKGETSKARARRLREGWFDKWAPEGKPGIDIGCSHDPLNQTFRRFDFIFGDGDATTMDGVPNDLFHTVYASNVLEHLSYPHKAIQRWYEICRPGGHLIIIVPHRELYEKKRFLPSTWNPEHTYFWLPDQEDPPCTKSLKKEVLNAIPDADIVEFRTIDEGYDYSLGKHEHAVGEFGIEIIVRKPKKVWTYEQLPDLKTVYNLDTEQPLTTILQDDVSMEISPQDIPHINLVIESEEIQ